MSRSKTFMRFASPNERRTISREDLGFYNAVVIAAIYEVGKEDVDVNSPQSFIPPLKHCILTHPYLSVVVKNKNTEKPAYEAVSSINLEDHISIIRDDEASSDGETETLERVLHPILDRPWPADLPPWRIVVLPLVLPSDTTVTRCFIAFSFCHSLGDGMVGPAFHRTFLDAWCQTSGTSDKETSFLVTPPSRTLPAPFDTPERLPISWGFLLGPILAVYLPTFLAKILGLRAAASTVDAGTWTGSPMFAPTSDQSSRVTLLEIEAPLVQKALQASRKHDAKLTGTMHQLIVRALSKAIPNRDITKFASQTAVDMRGSIGTPGYTWGLFVSGYYEVHPRLLDVEQQPALSDELWAAASSMTEKLAECSTRLQDQAIGLLRYAPSIRNWTLGKIGHQRDCSYEVSNLLAFDGSSGDANHKYKITKMVFVQPSNVLSGPLVFNVISVKGGSLMCAVSWQVGALGVPVEEETSFVDGICSSLRADFGGLSD